MEQNGRNCKKGTASNDTNAMTTSSRKSAHTRRIVQRQKKNAISDVNDHAQTERTFDSSIKSESYKDDAAEFPTVTSYSDHINFFEYDPMEFRMPSLPNSAGSVASYGRNSSPSFSSNYDAEAARDAAASLVHIKRGQILPTPTAKKCHSSAEVNESSVDSGDAGWKQENVSPMIPSGSSQVYSRQHVPTPRKFTYPPPPSMKYSVTGTPTPVVQAFFENNVKSDHIFSPSYVENQCKALTPSTALALDSLPPCDSIPYKTTPMQGDECRHKVVQPEIESSSNQELVPELSPLPFSETPKMTCELELFKQTSDVLQDQDSTSEDSCFRLPSYSPLISCPPGATAV